MAEAYPLSWPEGFPRAKGREAGRFKVSIDAALKNVRGSLRLFGNDSGRSVTNVILSSNVALGLSQPTDPGVAAWFLWDGEQRCVPVDRYTSPAANLQAIHHIIEARRVELRHGSLTLVRASFKGFTLALPAPGTRRPWPEVLELSSVPRSNITRATIEAAHKRLARDKHPDNGGSTTAMTEVNVARDEALREVSSA